MFCRKCGNELGEGETYCQKCGTKVGEGELSAARSMANDSLARLEKMGKAKKWYIGSLLLLAISLFMVCAVMFEATYTVFVTHSVEMTLFENHDTLKLLIILGYLVSILLILLPVLMNKDLKKIYFDVGKWMSVVSVVLLVVVFFNAKKILLSSEFGEILQLVNFSIKFTANAWVFIVLSFFTCLTTYTAGYLCTCDAP